MPFELDDEKATDVLIWWVEGADGSIDYREEQAVARILEQMDYSLKTFYEETFSHISSLSNEHIGELVDEAVKWGNEQFSEDQKKLVYSLLENIATSTGEITDEQEKKLTIIRDAFGI